MIAKIRKNRVKICLMRATKFFGKGVANKTKRVSRQQENKEEDNSYMQRLGKFAHLMFLFQPSSEHGRYTAVQSKQQE